MSSANPSQTASASPMPEGVTDPNYRPLPGRLGNLTVVQLHTLEKFKKELQDEGHFVPERMDDATLLRYVLVILYIEGSVGVVRRGRGPARDEWILIGVFDRFLRARKFDLAKAKIMLISAEQWRKDEKVDEIAKCDIFNPSIILLTSSDHFSSNPEASISQRRQQ
jgi:CRAL/TRIO, N-terminal domain